MLFVARVISNILEGPSLPWPLKFNFGGGKTQVVVRFCSGATMITTTVVNCKHTYIPRSTGNRLCLCQAKGGDEAVCSAFVFIFKSLIGFIHTMAVFKVRSVQGAQ